MDVRISRIVIVGGGTAGWMTAAALIKNLRGGRYTVDLVESEEIGTVGVGEATIPSIIEFNNSLQINEAEFMRATQASIKLGIEFVDWTRAGHTFIHPFGFYGVQMEGIYFHNFWLRHHANGGKLHYDLFNSNSAAAIAGRFQLPSRTPPSPLPSLGYAYHFDAGLYAGFLRKFAEKLGVRRHEGKVVHVQQRASDGFVESVKLADGRVIEGDLFIDCSGFRGLLIEQTLGAGYEDWTEWLPCDRAMAVPCDRVAQTTVATRSTAREAGWQWRIPLQHRTGNGYVYCSAFLGDDEAARLLLGRLDGTPRAEPRPLRFVTGRRKEIWKKNVVAIGLSSGFLEPLESTSIHLILSTISRLLFMFPGDGFAPATIAAFNKFARDELEEVRDLLVMHYNVNERDDSPFWKHCKTIRRPDSLETRLQLYRENAAIMPRLSEIFREPSWFAVFTGQNVFPRSYHPFADLPSDAELDRRMTLMASDVQKRVMAFPTHDEFLREYCPAERMS
jgi:tryptophan halogenase